MAACPSAEELSRLVRGELGGEASRVAAHVEGCRCCQEWLDHPADGQAEGLRRVLSLPFPTPVPGGLAEAQGEDEGGSAAAGSPLMPGTEPVEGAGPDTPGDPTDPAASPEAPASLGRYRLLGELGHGGMGTVLRGHDPDLGRDLAIKILLDAHGEKPELVRRFVEEAQISGQLQHPGIVPVYELGTLADQRPYFTMKLVKGRTLAALLKERPDPAHDLTRFLSVFGQVCQTLAYAHARGVIHRDLKPANIMVGAFGEVQVMDWGLAKVLLRDGGEGGGGDEGLSVIDTTRSGPDGDTTLPGSVLGTPAYMSPEQARGEVERLDARADVFGLGSMLCETLTGAPAYAGGPSRELRRRAACADLTDALGRLGACGADGELIGLARACLAADPADRPVDAGAVADRLAAYQAGVQERLRRAELERAEALARAAVERRRRRAERGLVAAALVVFLLIGGGASVLYQQRRWERARIQQAMSKVGSLYDQAEADPDDRVRWAAASEAARQLVDSIVGRGDAESRSRAEALRDRIERDRRLLSDLDEARLQLARGKRGNFDSERSAESYRKAFRSYGIDVEALADGAVLERLEGCAFRGRLAVALDNWARRIDGGLAERLRKLAQQIDPDPISRDVRRAMLGRDLAALRALAARCDDSKTSPIVFEHIGESLLNLGAAEEAEAVLRRAQGRHPDDVWINHDLAWLLLNADPPQTDDAIRFYSAALARRPDSPGMHNGLGLALLENGELDAAIAEHRRAIEIDPEDAEAHCGLGDALRARGRADEAIAECRRAVEIDSGSADYHDYLGDALRAGGRFGEAIEEYRRAVVLNPANSVFHNDLGSAFYGEGRFDEAIAEYRRAIALKPDDAAPHDNLGDALRARGRLDEAIAEHRRAIALRPDNAVFHDSLGRTLWAGGLVNGAITAYRNAIELRPDEAVFHSDLGNALYFEDRFDEAIAEHRRAVALKPDDAAMHCNLGRALLRECRFAEALAEFNRGNELGSQRPGWDPSEAEWVRWTRRIRGIEGRLTAILKGEDRPEGSEERIAFAKLAYYKGLHGASARFYEETFEADRRWPDELRSGHRYNAACAAALAGVGRGLDDPPPDEAARVRWREKARHWLAADLAAWAGVPATGDPQSNVRLQRKLSYWKADLDLAGVRDAEELAKLPEAERAAWSALWAEVEALRRKAANAAARPGG